MKEGNLGFLGGAPQEFTFFNLDLVGMRNAGGLPLLVKYCVLDWQLRERGTPSFWSYSSGLELP